MDSLLWVVVLYWETTYSTAPLLLRAWALHGPYPLIGDLWGIEVIICCVS